MNLQHNNKNTKKESRKENKSQFVNFSMPLPLLLILIFVWKSYLKGKRVVIVKCEKQWDFANQSKGGQRPQ
jgi:hypothetical protein